MENKGKKKIIIGITSLVLVTLIILGLTYAYYRTRILGNPTTNSINVVTKKLGISYSDNQPLITATNIEPGYNNEETPKTFTVHNTGDDAGTFNIIIDNVVNGFNKGTSRGEYNDWTYELYQGTTISSDTLLKTGEITTEEKQILLENVLINAKEEITYTLIIRYANLTNIDQSDDMGQTLSLRVNIEDASISGGSTQENPLLNAQQGTLLYALRTNNPVSEPLTVPGQEASLEDEAVFAETEDDYGTSYYFRGNVQNNYVNYSGMCWRIVRVDGNGNIKIILADRNGECNSSSYSKENTLSAFIQLIDGYEDNPIIQTYFDSFTDDISSYSDWGVIEELDTWIASANLDISKLETTNWCNDSSYYKKDMEYYDNEGNPIDGSDPNLIDQSYYFKYYNIEKRLENEDGLMPTLKCNMTGIEDSKATNIYSNIGLITADETVLAGAIYDSYNSSYNYVNYYLLDNSTGNHYYTMTPCFETNATTDKIIVVRNSTVYESESQGGLGALRPAVVLKSSVLVTTDSTSTYEAGSHQNPYVVS